MFLIRHQGGVGGEGQVINPEVLKNSSTPPLLPHLPCVSPPRPRRQRNLSPAVTLSRKRWKSATDGVCRGGCRGVAALRYHLRRSAFLVTAAVIIRRGGGGGIGGEDSSSCCRKITRSV